MSDTQFSSLSPTSSYDIEIGNRHSEVYDFGDQETLTITSNKSVANLGDFDDDEYGKSDPFLSDYMREESEDLSKVPLCLENFIETNDTNMFFSSLSPENESDDCIFVFGDGLDELSPYYLDLETISPANPLSFQRQIANKRAFSPRENLEFAEMPLPTKQRRVEVSSHVRCDEWINKYHEIPDRFSLKASGMLDRRKTKHHKVLDEYDSELQIENIDCNGNRVSLFVQKKISMSENTPLTFSSQKTHSPVSLSTQNPTKIPTIRSINHVIRKPFIHCNHNNDFDNKAHILNYSQPSSPSNHISTIDSPINLSGSSRALSDIIDMPRIPGPLRMGKRVSRRGHRLSLWQYLMCLLDSIKYHEHSTGIKWLNRNNGVFHIIDSKQVATLWGQYKERRDKMTYDSLARSLRHYYKKNLMAKINNRRLVYQIAQECIQWSTETFLKKTK